MAAARRLNATVEHLGSSVPPRMQFAEASIDRVFRAMQVHGYCVVENFVSKEKVAEMRAELLRALSTVPDGRNSFEGFGTKRLYAVFGKVRCMDDLAIDPMVLGVMEKVLGSKHIQLSSPTGIQIGDGEKAQVLHRDEGKYPVPRPHPEIVVNTMWAVDDFTETNGATVIVPGSHTRTIARGEQGEADVREARAQSVVLRRRTEEAAKREIPAGAIPATMPAGSCMFYLGSLLHGGGANRSGKPRLGIILEYASGWLRPQETHLLAVPRETAKKLPERLQELLGYDVHPPFLGYVDGRHPKRLLR
eukprot:TRINITY_DN4308_c0_g3_i1.p1 TRINITY_DN4308_c0_g3~~TRINITY_DN4308_c0_g3_i1.p1  ORF type:complete len:328 (+),score=114.67 TRINITY_DN4308_c0_g3_i1:72-986(+)